MELKSPLAKVTHFEQTDADAKCFFVIMKLGQSCRYCQVVDVFRVFKGETLNNNNVSEANVQRFLVVIWL